MHIKTIPVEVDFVPEWHEDSEGVVTLVGLRFPGCNQNILQFLSRTEREQAQSGLEHAYERQLEAKHEQWREKHSRFRLGSYRSPVTGG